MKIFTKEQIKAADEYTVVNKPVASIDLMEWASETIAAWIEENIDKRKQLLFVVGKGNNGGDGLAVARIMNRKGFNCLVYMVYDVESLSEECAINFKRITNIPEISFIDTIAGISSDIVIIDAILGAGISGNIKKPVSEIILHINELNNQVISIDLPSGMQTEFNSPEQLIVKADITLTLEFPKLAMLLPETGEFAGKIVVLPIGLDKRYVEQTDTVYNYIDGELIDGLKKRRLKFGYKNTYGHALLVCGSRYIENNAQYSMTGAAILAANAALRSGCGLVTVHVPCEERVALQTNCPSAILSLDRQHVFSDLPSNITKYNAIGIGCGTGTHCETEKAFAALLQSVKIPLVIDADAINILSQNRKLLKYVPHNSILTPHLGELKRLTGEWLNEKDKSKKTTEFASEYQLIVVVKGAHSSIYLPDGNIWFNSTGNPGMAKGGSGDVLTGLITGLLARGYNSFEAAVLGVYFHGLAGDKAKEKYGEESMNSLDLIEFIRL
ncbi:MAG: NAD(P)H-hydrate dehydratase [Prevotellaceae bacterium]|jgi:NAD(P)H-hydrate epimerase|nr:NAD(P)H-hydrate dehydratase [Prevotellaceae bacterium]